MGTLLSSSSFCKHVVHTKRGVTMTFLCCFSSVWLFLDQQILQNEGNAKVTNRTYFAPLSGIDVTGRPEVKSLLRLSVLTRLRPLHPLVYAYFVRLSGVFRFPGAMWDHFLCTAKPQPSQTRFRKRAVVAAMLTPLGATPCV